MSDLNIIVATVRRMVNDPVISGSSIRNDYEMGLYLEDANDAVFEDVDAFTNFTITGTSITPDPDRVDKRLLALQSAKMITQEDYRESVGDSILLQTGCIKIDTTKGTKSFNDFYKELCLTYNNLVTELNINGKSSNTLSIGGRVDNYKQRTSDVRASDSLL